MIEDLWQHVKEANAFRRVSETHPLDLYVGLSTHMERTLLLRLDHEPPTLPLLRKLRITRQPLDHGRWNLIFSVLNPSDNPLFNALCADLVEFTRTATASAHPDEVVLRRLSRWRTLLQGEGGGLSDKELRGLAAELLVLQNVLIPRLGPAAVSTWAGPLGAPQDFDLGDAFWEVKSTHSGSTQVTINSLEQLSTPGRLFLVCVRLDQGRDSGESVPDLVSAIANLLEPHAVFAETFAARLAAVGYESEEKYQTVRFHFNGLNFYEVDDGFPRIRPESVPSGVSDVSYKISLGAIQGWMTEVPLAGGR